MNIKINETFLEALGKYSKADESISKHLLSLGKRIDINIENITNLLDALKLENHTKQFKKGI